MYDNKNQTILLASYFRATVETREKFEKENIAPNKNMDHQWKFQKTSQPSGRKKRGQIATKVNTE